MINNLGIDCSGSSKLSDGDDIVISVDSTGIKVTNRGQWMHDKWNTKRRKAILKSTLQ